MMAIPRRDPGAPPPAPAHIPHIHAVPPRSRPHVATTTTSSFAMPPPTYSSLAELSLAASVLLPRRLTASGSAIPPALRRCCRRPNGRLVWDALFDDGLARAAARFVVAILTNHVRRMLLPWLGAWVCATPLADLKMASGSPHLFLDAQLLASAPAAFGGVALMMAQKAVVDLLGGAAARMVVGADANGAPRTARDDPRRRRVEVATVGVLVWALAAAEYVQARTFHAVAVVIAVWKLVSGPSECSPAAYPRTPASVLAKYFSSLNTLTIKYGTMASR
ncbi:hypothetical protein HYQ44_012035 [Verticillium longisporum]|nr:hypothetical protein HYQ44_012035 [Verticillium longisporum]